MKDTPREALEDYYEATALAPTRGHAARVRSQPPMVGRYYDAVTRLYEYGWSPSFHFSPRRPNESLVVSQRRHEQGIGTLLGLKPGMKVADVGCGIGEPMITICKATGASITGVNVNAVQIGRGEQKVRKVGLEQLCDFMVADYMDAPIEDGTFDAIYTFESICHAPDTRQAFRELHRMLKPGGEIAVVDWCLTEGFDAENPSHTEIRDRIEWSNATPDLLTTRQQTEAAAAAGFEVVDTVDQATLSDPRTPWYMALQSRDLSLTSFGRLPFGRLVTVVVTSLLERLRLAPPGTGEAARLLNVAADSLVAGGEAGIFTPSFMIHGRKA